MKRRDVIRFREIETGKRMPSKPKRDGPRLCVGPLQLPRELHPRPFGKCLGDPGAVDVHDASSKTEKTVGRIESDDAEPVDASA